MTGTVTTRRGMRDRVAIVGMACTHFGELFDKGIDVVRYIFSLDKEVLEIPTILESPLSKWISS